MSRDLFYYLSVERYITVNHSGHNHISDNKTTAIAFQFISVVWHLATPFSISTSSIETFITGHVTYFMKGVHFYFASYETQRKNI